MHRITLLTTAVTHQLYRTALTVTGRRSNRATTDCAIDCAPDEEASDRDRGAVSLEQVFLGLSDADHGDAGPPPAAHGPAAS